MSDIQEYMLRWRGRQSGPYPIAEIDRMLDDHKIGMGHEILYGDEWITLEKFFAAIKKAASPSVEQTKPAVAAIPPAPAAPATVRLKGSVPQTAGAVNLRPPEPVVGEAPPRHRLVFALLAVFMGFLGVHNLYARQWLTGMLQLLLTVATWLMGFGIIASWVWAMVEAVAVRKDAHGVNMI
jgi:TM2 domain-containing membrane protein YozV